MREIMFKGKRTDNEEWIFGSLQCFKGFSIFCNIFNSFFAVKSKTVCQCTGVPDRTGKKIFEKDILQDIKGDFYIVVWSSRNAMFRCVCIGQTYKLGNNRNLDAKLAPGAYTIIGNTIDNPELVNRIADGTIFKEGQRNES